MNESIDTQSLNEKESRMPLTPVDSTARPLDRLPRTGGVGRRRLTSGLLAIGLGVVLAACSSNSSSTTTTTAAPSSSSTSTPSNVSPAVALQDFIKGAPTSTVALSENGSSLLAPLFSTWATGYSKIYPKISITTADAGSGTGIADAIAGTVNIGASDAYLPPSDFSESGGMENIPLAVSAQQVNYNLPGLANVHIKLTGTILSDIYDGKITKWNDSAITNINPGVNLPDMTIVPLHRSDSSGDTFLFTSFLAASDPSSWVAAAGGPSPSITFPTVAGGQGEEKNSGMLAGCQGIKGCIAYIGISYLQKTEAAGLGYAALANASGNYILPGAAGIQAEEAAYSSLPANGAKSLIYGPAAQGYPIINFEYAIVKVHQPSATTEKAVVSQLAWDMDPTEGSASSYLTPVNFQPLTSSALAVSISLLQKLQG